MSYFKELQQSYLRHKHEVGDTYVADPVQHVLDVLKEFDSFSSAVHKRTIKSRVEILDSLRICSELLNLHVVQLPANVENFIKQFCLRIDTMRNMIARKDGVYKLKDLDADLHDRSKGRLIFLEQSIKNHIRMYKDGTSLPPITDKDRSSLNKHYAKLDKLPERLNQPFAVLTSGVVPLFEDFNVTTDKMLKLVGFSYERVGDSFVILKNQHLLALDVNKITEMAQAAETDAAGKPKKKKVAVDLPKVIADLLTTVNRTSREKYALMSDKLIRNPKNGDIAFAWLIKEEQLRMLSRLARTTRLQSWDVPHRRINLL